MERLRTGIKDLKIFKDFDIMDYSIIPYGKVWYRTGTGWSMDYTHPMHGCLDDWMIGHNNSIAESRGRFVRWSIVR